MVSSQGFNTKTPTIKRILKEAAELESQPSSDLYATPLESNLFEWHFTIRGPPAPSPYAAGIYHGRIVLPPTYPLRPPSFRFLTPTGRFEVNREICLSISGHHEETWQPAWGIRTALVAIRSFMDSEAKGQVGGLDIGRDVRERLARESGAWKCAGCGKTNREILKEREEAEACAGEEAEKSEDVVPDELRLAYREDLAVSGSSSGTAAAAEADTKAATVAASSAAASASSSQPAQPPRLPPTRTVSAPAPRTQAIQQANPDRSLAWIDTCIYGIVAALLFIVLRKMAS